MCGIMGYAGSGEAAPVILDGLKRLEYRGYDSAGVALYDGERFRVLKRKGRLSVLEAELEKQPLPGSIGIGHTRWATHGEPSDANSHPHVGSQNKIAIAHNGIVENYKTLREYLIGKGVEFASDTDSEVVAQLAEHYYSGNLLETVAKVINAIEGSFALEFMCLDEPDRIIAVKKYNPLIIGIAQGATYVASDVPAILRHTRQVVYLADKEIAVLTRGGAAFYNMDMEPLQKTPETISWNMDSAEKGGYEHFMYKEIMEQPRVIEDTLASVLPGGRNEQAMGQIDISRFDKIKIVACGSAYNAGSVGRYAFERLCRIPTEADLASEFRYRDALIDARTLVILVSQSGETADTIAATLEAKSKGAATLAIVNVVGSTIAKEADCTVYTMAGPEIAVATTKAFSAQLIVLYMLAIRFAQRLGRISEGEAGAMAAELGSLPGCVRRIFGEVEKLQHYAATCFNSKSIFFIGRNIDYAIAMEGSLKLKEISYIHSEAYAGGELKHGTISLIEDNTLVVAISCSDRLAPKTESNVEQVISRGAKVLLVTNGADPFQSSDKVFTLREPKVSELFSPSLSVVLLQLFSYYVAANKGCDIDKPRNLAKSVTVE
ncbi:MAG: glutamine--fructose-6-phosphate transaminase (isomerizing) [Clostridiales bacterium]|jgi:glucosamine--fructose-6-phosphate aminotransferase (isomerizing)|nr:glutamine--fructose-6-phosphate transaminase (isomerizing) [Clostridiales bacterium]